MTYAIILLGFDVSHVIRTINMYKPHEVSFFIASIRGINERVNLALNMAIQYSLLLNIKHKYYPIDILDLHESIDLMRGVVQEYASKSQLIIDASGGPRLLIVELFLACLSLPSELLKKIKLVIFVEGSQECIELDYMKIIRALALGTSLKEIEKELLISMKPGDQYALRELHDLLIKKGRNYSKQYILKILKSLEEKGLVIKIGHGKYLRKL